MKGEKLLRAIGLVEDDLILEADAPLAPKKKKTVPWRWLSLAACAVLACMATLLLRTGGYSSAAPEAGAEALDENALQGQRPGPGAGGAEAGPAPFALGESGSGGFGFEGLLEFAPSEL